MRLAGDLLLPRSIFILTFLFTLGLASCARPASAPLQPAGSALQDPPLRVVATTSIVADVVRQVGGEAIDLSVLLPVGTDTHAFEPSPQDISRVAEADLVFANGAGLEEFLGPLLENAGGDARLVAVSDGIALREGEHESEVHESGSVEDEAGHTAEQGQAAGAEEQPGEHEGDEAHEHTLDPHTFTDPNNVLIWTQNIEKALKEMDPQNAELYAGNAEQYRQELVELDAWVRERVERIPANRRLLVTDHQVFTYFAEEYGFEQVGAIIPAFSSVAEPSAREIAQLEDAIHELDVKAIFVGAGMAPSLAERIAADTGTRLVRVYTESLSEEGGEADNYLDYVRYNVNAIVGALHP
jgi:ABC-type Zn uptake system ZnuABC Zn-binding protein ZnuA